MTSAVCNTKRATSFNIDPSGMSSGGLLTRYFTGGLGGFLRFFRVRSSGFPVSPFPLFSSLLPEVVLPSSVASESLSESLSESVGRPSSGGFGGLVLGFMSGLQLSPLRRWISFSRAVTRLSKRVLSSRRQVLSSRRQLISSRSSVIFFSRFVVYSSSFLTKSYFGSPGISKGKVMSDKCRRLREILPYTRGF